MMQLLALLFCSVSSFAYVPEYGLIASRAADMHGKGAYQIEQEVTYRRETEFYSIKETWTVLGENNLRVTLEGRGPLKGLVQGTIIYEGSQKSYADGSAVKNLRVTDDWLEPFLHFRSSKYFRSRLVNLKVTSAEALRDRAPLNSEGPPVYEPPSFIRLSRTGGSVAWAIGMNPSVGTSPQIWIEQDQFLVRKFRGANQSVFRADNYAKYGDSMWYPRTIRYNFGDHVVQVNTLSVKSLGGVTHNDSRFKTSSLNPAKDSLKIPDNEALREFYSRFR
jgi:hypothetical protein